MSENYFSNSYGLPLWNPQSPQINRYNNLTQQQQQYNNIPTSNMNWVQVTNMQSAKEQIVQPNTTMWMMDNFLPQIYVKAVDNTGTTNFKGYKLVEIEEQPPVDVISVDKINKLEEALNNLQNKINMYEQQQTKSSTRKGGTTNESTK